MAIEEREPANSEANVSRIHDDEGVFLSGEEEDEILDNNLPSTQAEQRRAQKAVFESWLQTEAAQQPMRRTKQHKTEEPEDEYLSIKALMAKQESAEIVKNPREYQLELFERAKKENTIAVLDTGSGKTLIAVLLIRWMIDQELELRASGKPHRVTFFLVASVALMFQQHAVLEANLDHKIARFCGAMNVHKWTKDVWCQHFSENKVVVCTADVLLQCLSHSFITMKQINLLVFDEAHHAKKDHAYATIIKDYYKAETTQNARPRIFGMTASPVDSKAEVYQSAMDLETVLHSRIATATDLSFQEILKKNDERILPYAPKRPAFETELLRATKARFFHVKVLQQTFDTAKDVAAELGCWCADQYLASALAEQNLRKYESRLKRDARKCSTARSESDIDKEMAEVRQASEFVAAQWNCGQINRDDLSDKVKQLTVFLSEEFQRPSDYRCLVFVDQRKVARLLFELFKRQGYEHLRPGLLVGAGNKDLDEMTSCRQQVLTITQFRKGDINCLFATSVAEEGLDVPDCNLVIRFSLYTNMVQYIQSRGRARQANSRFIHMVEIGNHKEADLLREVRYSELRMKSFCQALPEDRRIQGNQDAHEKLMKKESALKVHTLPTEAKLTFGNALGILANFVSAVPTDSDEPQHPTYVVTGPAGNFTAEVLLPPGAPFRSQTGESQTRRSLAKRSAAFEACHALLRKKYLNDYLLPVYAKKLPAMRNAHLAVNSKKTLTYNMMVKPLIWEQSRGKLPGELFITVVQFPDGLGRDCQPFAMLSRTPMPRFPAFPVFLRDDKGSRVATCPIEKALPVNEHTLTLLTSFTLRVFKDVFSKTYENNVSQMSYWLAPVNDAQAVDCAPFDLLDWRLMQEVFEHEQYIWTAEMPDAALLNRFFVDKWDGGRKLYSKSVSQTLKPLDPVPAGTAKGKWKANILDYSNTMFKKTREKFKDTWDLSQPVIEMETALARRNVLVVPNLKEANEPTQAFVCPQPLHISVLPPRMAVSLFVWPSIIWRLESYLIALEACSVVGVQCDPAMALAAITKDSDNSGDHDAEERINFQHGMGENYERLEFLGDCFLKTATTLSTFVQLPGENEFKMHVARMVMLCNRNLFKVAKGLKLYEFIRSRAFSRRLWYPEGLKLLEGKGAQKTEETEEEMRVGSMHNLAEKTIADVCEAMIGAAFLSHNQPGNWHPDHWENAIRTVTKLVASDNHKILTWNDYRAAYRPPEYEIADVTASQRDMADKVEQEHNYHFQDPRLLRSAFIHPSQPFLYEKLPNYQRLEFLGDALLDQASITYLFYKFPDKDPQWLTEHKMAMIGNRALGMVAATTGFHKHIRHCHATVEQQIRDYVTDLQDAKEAAGPNVADYWTAVSDPPKCLADIVEAYIGAVFIDSGFDYNEVQRFFDMHIKPHFEDMSLYDGYANNHPCTHLHHVLDQTYGCQQYRIIAKQVPMLGAFDSKGVVVAVMIHNEVFAHDMGQSVRYARVRVAKTALEKLEGLGLADFRARFMCQCSKDVQADGAADGVHADCGI